MNQCTMHACKHIVFNNNKKNRWWWYRHAHIKPCSLLIQKRGTTLFICTSIVACRRFKFATLQSTLSLFSRCLFYPLSHTRTVALYILTPHSLKILRKILYKMNNWFSIVRKWWEKRMKKSGSTILEWHWYWLKIEWTFPMKLSTSSSISQKKFICLIFAWWWTINGCLHTNTHI